jgi:hypothetical protein
MKKSEAEEKDWRSGFEPTRRDKRGFRGDEKNYLPRAVLDYRMWFEMLKLAHREPAYSIQEKRYVGWEQKGLSLTETLDSIKSKKVGSGFKKWFHDQEHWRTLFSIPVQPTAIVRTSAAFQKSLKQNRLVLAVTLGKTVPELRAEVEEILIAETRRRGSRKGQAPRSDAAYVIPPNKQIEMTTYIRMLRIYECDGDKVHWTKMYEELHQGYPNPPRELKVDMDDELDRRRVYQMIFRDRRRLNLILKNVCKGEFPGEYA